MKNKTLLLLYVVTLIASILGIKIVSANTIFEPIPRFFGERYTIKSKDDQNNLYLLDGKYAYVAFSDGITFEDKEIYVARASYIHFTDPNKGYGKIAFFVRDNNSSSNAPFKLVYPNIDYEKYESQYGEFRDANLSTTNIPGIFLLSCSTAYACDPETHKGCRHASLLMVMNSNYEVLSEYMFMNSDGSAPVSRMVFGNTLTTPNGYLLQTIYGSSNNQKYTYLYRSDKVFTGTLEGLSFKYIKKWGGDGTVSNDISNNDDDFDDSYDLENEDEDIVSNGTSNSTLTPSETTIGYYNDKLVMIFRTDGTSYITYTDDLEGTKNAVWTNPMLITDIDGNNMKLHSPLLLQSYIGDSLIFAGSLWVSGTGNNKVRYPIIGKINIENGKVIEYQNIDEEITGYSGYPSLVPTADGYGMMYYEDVNMEKTGLYFKDISKTESTISPKNKSTSIVYGSYVISKLSFNDNFIYSDLNSRFTITDQNLLVKNKEGTAITDNSQNLGTNSKIILSDQEYTLILTGDANGDGVSDIVDAKKIAQDIVDKIEFNKIDVYASDMNKDGMIKMNDVMRLVIGK